MMHCARTGLRPDDSSSIEPMALGVTGEKLGLNSPMKSTFSIPTRTLQVSAPRTIEVTSPFDLRLKHGSSGSSLSVEPQQPNA